MKVDQRAGLLHLSARRAIRPLQAPKSAPREQQWHHLTEITLDNRILVYFIFQKVWSKRRTAPQA